MLQNVLLGRYELNTRVLAYRLQPTGKLGVVEALPAFACSFVFRPIEGLDQSATSSPLNAHLLLVRARRLESRTHAFDFLHSQLMICAPVRFVCVGSRYGSVLALRT